MHLARSLAFAVTSFVTLCQTSAVFAQTSDSPSMGAKEPSSTGKGIVGGALLGAEVVLLTEAAIDVSPDWLYYVGGLAGAAGGGIAGYYLEDSLSSQANMFLLAGGMLLVIPTTVAVLSATAYEQSSEYTQDQAPKDEPAADPVLPGSPPNSTPTPASSAGQPTTPPSDPANPSSGIAPAPAPRLASAGARGNRRTETRTLGHPSRRSERDILAHRHRTIRRTAEDGIARAPVASGLLKCVDPAVAIDKHPRAREGFRRKANSRNIVYSGICSSLQYEPQLA